MRRRTWASLLAVALLVGLSIVAASKPVPYVTFSPAFTVNTLGSFENKDVISVHGHRAYRDKGALRLTTVQISGPDDKVSLPTLLFAWLDPDRSVYPYDTLYGKTDTRQSVHDESAAQMASSQDNAVAAALGAL